MKFKINDLVEVVPKPNDLFNQEFLGRIIGFERDCVQVRDQEDVLYDLDRNQIFPFAVW